MTEPSVEVRVRMAGGAEDVRWARRVVVEALQGSHSGVDLDETLLLADELVSNAVIHAGGALELAVQAYEGRVWVEVRDASPELPVLRQPGDTEEGGRGLQIVDRLAFAWGASPLPDNGKTVWFESAPPEPTHRASGARRARPR
jgi:anti-sigma regulatory factor (Ser/Thr protein kinase)